jgi:predicted permease
VTPRTRLVGVGARWALAVAFPADLVAQVADAAHTGDGHSPLLVPCAVVILLGTGLGGAVVGARARPLTRSAHATADRADVPVRRSWELGALAGLAAIAVVLILGLARSLLAGESVSWASVPFLLALGATCGAIGAVLGEARARTSRP